MINFFILFFIKLTKYFVDKVTTGFLKKIRRIGERLQGWLKGRNILGLAVLHA